MAAMSLHPALQSLQDRTCSLLGCPPGERNGVVTGMLRADRAEIAAYWLQIVVSAGIATLGLILGSTAVVIGAMLVAPLMSPIVGIAMGLATGGPVLTIRSFLRVLGGVVVVLLTSAAVTRLSPLRELTPEISARTAPTVLDLLVATLCALAGAHATLRPASSTASAAAGTAIGISLVPPLCASGFGLATGSMDVARGALLLFVTNAAAIVVVGALVFVAAGFVRVRAVALEAEFLERAVSRRWHRSARRLAAAFTSRWGVMLRFLMPLALVATVVVPLRTALDQLAWQAGARSAVRSAIGELKAERVAERVRVERGRVDVGLAVLGGERVAEEARASLLAALAARGIADATVRIVAIPAASDVTHVREELLAARVPPAPPPAADSLQRGRRAVEDELRRAWPSGAAGPPLRVTLEMSGEGVTVACAHLGPPLDAAATEAVAGAVSRAVGRAVAVRDQPLPREPLALAGRDVGELDALGAPLALAASLDMISTCATEPPRPAGRTSGARHDAFEARLRELLGSQPRASVAPGERWSLRFVEGACAPEGAVAAP